MRGFDASFGQRYRVAMAAKFYVVGSFFVRSRNLFVAVGDVVEGDVAVGMNVSVNLGSISVAAKIASSEVIDVEYMNRSYKGLAFALDQAEDLEFWNAIRISNETLTIESDAPDAS